jgi:UDP:flavonoid glycosyltransferase YjiC (YdhE family)
LKTLVEELTRERVATVLYTGSDEQETVSLYSTEYVTVATQPLDLPATMAQADFAILNGTHATTVAALLAGRPSIHFPLVLEQWMFALRVNQLGGGEVIRGISHESLTDGVDRVIKTALNGAQRFSSKYALFDPYAALTAAVDVVEAVTSERGCTVKPALYN